MDFILNMLGKTDIGVVITVLCSFYLLNEKINKKFNQFESKIDEKFEKSEVKTDKRFGIFENRTDKKFDILESKIDKRFDDIERKIDKLDDKILDVDRRLCRLEGAFNSKDCCALKESTNLREVK